MNQHWDNLLGWYEKNPSSILELLDLNLDWKDSIAFLPGIGTSDIFEELLSRKIKLFLNDISQKALEKIGHKLGDRINNVTLYNGNIAKTLSTTIPKVDLWIDRAGLHFLIEETDIDGYFQNLKSIVKKGGFALFAQFSTEGATKCAGLNIHRYSLKDISERLGDNFQVVNQFDHTYINPYGDPRPYIYVLYKRLNL